MIIGNLDFITMSSQDIDFIPNDKLWGAKGKFSSNTLYAECYTTNHGAIVKYNPPDSNQGCCIVMSGQVLEKMREAGQSDSDILSWSYGNAKRITRLDWALTTDFSGLSPQKIEDGVRSGIIKTMGNDILKYEKSSKRGAMKGDTRYIGSRTSERFFRCYDKGLEMGNLSQALYRAEMEWKGRVPSYIAPRMIKDGVNRVGLANMLDYVALDNLDGVGGVLSQLGNRNPDDVPKIGKKETDFEKYLDGVYKAIKNRWETENSVIMKFIDKLGAMMLEDNNK